MLLAIDAGNTNIVFALFDQGDLIATWRSATDRRKTADDYAVFLHGMMTGRNIPAVAITGAIIGSVVPEANFNLIKLCHDYFKCEPLIVGGPNFDLGIEILLDRPEEIGADRVINAIGGLISHKPPLLIVDFGTATTFDVVDADGNYAGGAIAPGINLSLQALQMAAAKLPRLDIAPTERVIGKNTQAAMQSGIYWGYTGLIDGMIARIKKEIAETTRAPVTVIATGGLAKLFAKTVTGIDHLDDTLTLRGMYKIFERHRAKQH